MSFLSYLINGIVTEFSRTNMTVSQPQKAPKAVEIKDGKYEMMQ